MPTTQSTTRPIIEPGAGMLTAGVLLVLLFLFLVTRSKRPVTQPVAVVQTGAGQAAVVGVLVEQPAPGSIAEAMSQGDTAMGQLAASWKAIKASYNGLVTANKTLTTERDTLKAQLDAAGVVNTDLSQRLADKDVAMAALDQRVITAEQAHADLSSQFDAVDLSAVQEIITSGSPKASTSSTSTVPDAPTDSTEDGPPPAAPASA